MRKYVLFVLVCISKVSIAQLDSIPPVQDTALRIINFSPFITLQADSTLNYTPELNKEGKYFWYLRNSPIGMKVNKENGTVFFKADKAFFLSGKLKYDFPYKVLLGVNNVFSNEKVDTSFTIIFYNTDIIPSKVKPTVNSVVYIDEGDTLGFTVQCEAGSFPIDNITFYSNIPIKEFSSVGHCNDDFSWTPSFEFVKDSDSAGVKIVVVNFIGTNRFMARDTAQVKIVVRNALNYPLAVQEYYAQVNAIKSYLLQLKYSFLQLDRNIKKVKNTRTAFDITSSATALTGTILNASSDPESKKVGQILPGVGVSLVPVKEAVSPQKVYDQNQASLVRSSIRRLEYMLGDNTLLSDKDPNVLRKTAKLKEELKQIQIQLIDIPIGIDNIMSEEELNQYFNNPKVNKKYRLKNK